MIPNVPERRIHIFIRLMSGFGENFFGPGRSVGSCVASFALMRCNIFGLHYRSNLWRGNESNKHVPHVLLLAARNNASCDYCVALNCRLREHRTPVACSATGSYFFEGAASIGIGVSGRSHQTSRQLHHSLSSRNAAHLPAPCSSSRPEVRWASIRRTCPRNRCTRCLK